LRKVADKDDDKWEEYKRRYKTALDEMEEESSREAHGQ